MSVNAPTRIHYNANTMEDDLYYKIDGSHFRLNEKESDPLPVYEKLFLANSKTLIQSGISIDDNRKSENRK